MIVRSKIKQIFSDELLGLIAAICDTKRIQSSQKKMKVLRDLLYTYKVNFEVLGGATNRIALFINGYAIKFAMDTQGYKDNLMEFSLSKELQPYVTKTYETNGYILVAECVKLMTAESFQARKYDILKILEELSNDYLLGDVGYLKKNMTNWGEADDGRPVILDYAYCHRATENLFTCNVCGEGILRYDMTYDHLMCSNRTVCHASYTYNERKGIQGDQVDLDMIEEVKKTSIILPEGESSKDVMTRGVTNKLMNSDTFIIETQEDLNKYVEVTNNMISSTYDKVDALDALVKAANAKSREDAKVKLERVEEQFREENPVPDVVYTDEFLEEQRRLAEEDAARHAEEELQLDEDDEYVAKHPFSLDDLVAMANNHPLTEQEIEKDHVPEDILGDYYTSKEPTMTEQTTVKETVETTTTTTTTTQEPVTPNVDTVTVDGKEA